MPACNQRLCAVNYRIGILYTIAVGVIVYQKKTAYQSSRPTMAPAQDTRKKLFVIVVDFAARYSAQLMVYHVDGNLNNSSLSKPKDHVSKLCG
jgi:hypothetical protein